MTRHLDSCTARSGMQRRLPLLSVALMLLTFLLIAQKILAVDLKLNNGLPVLVECYCDVDLLNANAVSTETTDLNVNPEDNFMDCRNHQFGSTGIRWYLNGPLDPTKIYWRAESERLTVADPTVYTLAKASYYCMSIPLYEKPVLGPSS